ncbi:hypothetical protein Dsin_014057 [Dipteronia sinensis]|uniref:non-specific serine/threonine protein kinase n=1 Tax=Dipteronia sinensis TaxID=43782 RepID=A0AAE0E9Z7_9ROSI|nr:hypothetical protein Dsin_014057 [Dipteronia sinensis]
MLIRTYSGKLCSVIPKTQTSFERYEKLRKIMQMFKQIHLPFFLIFALTVLVCAQDQSGFISLDCGLPRDDKYIELTTGINYISDANYIETGSGISILPEYKVGKQQQMWWIRSFPEGIRNCYRLNLTRGDKYLIRPSFMYGNYDDANKVPSFDVYIGPNLWGTLNFENASTVKMPEIIHVLPSDYLHFCLVNTGNGTPFISALELRLLKNTTYITQSGSLELYKRADIGSKLPQNQIYRYKDDVYDRLWQPHNFNNSIQLSTSDTIDAKGSNDYEPSPLAMQTAATPENDSQPLIFILNPAVLVSSMQYYIYMHFAEVKKLQANQTRAINISLNGQHWYGPFSPDYLSTTTVFTPVGLNAGLKNNFSIYKTENSTLPPILNAVEIYTLKEFLQLQTEEQDVEAITNIKATYGLKKNWQGDPCVPRTFLWDGLNCSDSSNDQPRITSLNLSSSGLSGKIADYLFNLKMLESLDLSNNNLSGSVPEFLSQVSSLKVLNLERNKLTGSIPAALLDRQNNKSLSLSFDGNPDLCSSNPCKKKKNSRVVVAVVVSVIAFVVILAALIVLSVLKRRKQQAVKANPKSSKMYESMEQNKQQFTYSNILKMTNNFERVLGKGGFGTVYYGRLDDTEVAVKMLSQSSAQGFKQFQSEVKLLMRVHHKDLTTLIGFCEDGTNLALIYEYMANGNLGEHLLGKIIRIYLKPLTSLTNLHSNSGLEYLHHGCKPPIIHRDVKSTNILLNDKFQAKLADFGLSRTFSVEGDTHVSTVVAGTPGYLDPECGIPIDTDIKSSTFSFYMGSNWDLGLKNLQNITPDNFCSLYFFVFGFFHSKNSCKFKNDIYTVAKGFISLDCGLPRDDEYTELTTGVNYISDANYIETGSGKSILPEYKVGKQQQMWWIRSFPEGIRNCYRLNLTRDDKYLIRANFMYGNYDDANKLPSFDVYIGPNFWGTLNFESASTVNIMEIIHVLPSDYLHFCLVNTGKGTPFISALELRLLENTTYITQSGSLALDTRADIGTTLTATYRYKDDVYDRIWQPINFSNSIQLSTSDTIDAKGSNVYEPAPLAMQTAATPENDSVPLVYFLNPAVSSTQYYIYMHFAEVVKLQANQTRVFNISLNGEHWYGPFSPSYLSTTTVFTRFGLNPELKNNFSIYKTDNSTLPPILNAVEIYTLKEFLQLQTEEQDVDAITNIKATYGLKKNWQGDPCVPRTFLWDGLSCSNNSNDQPRITSLNLSSSGLSGKIADYLFNLKMLESLDLSNNNLSGPVPEFLSQLSSLKVLNLERNKLTGFIPAALLDRQNNKSLSLSFDGNPDLCSSNPCKKKKNSGVVIAVVVSVIAFVVILAALIVLWVHKRRKQQAVKMYPKSSKMYESLEQNKQQFTYSNVLKMTNNFERVLGKGGFGTVYYGRLDDTEVAVKMLSQSSAQGFKQFQSEVKLLMRVHHKDLTTLIGFCEEGTNLALIYEYMANGNLGERLLDSDKDILNWETRLRMAVEAAQGLEYLHHGCKPPIIHRDVKSTNILLNDKFQAKLADFGLSRTFSFEGDTHVSTVVAGTPGYLDPE